MWAILILYTSIFANYQAEFKEFEIKKEELTNQYKIRIELAKIDKNKLRANLLVKTYICMRRSRSSAEIDDCRGKEQKRVLSYIAKKKIKKIKKF